MDRTWKSDDIGNVLDFHAFDFAVFGFVIPVGKKLADGRDAGPAVRLVHDLFGNEAVRHSPLGPNAGDGGRGIDQHAVHIE
jgi:hypothetical protein